MKARKAKRKAAVETERPSISAAALQAFAAHPGPSRAFVLPTPLPGVLPDGDKGMAQDSAITGAYSWAMSQAGIASPLFSAVGGFIGYSYLSELAQLPEYRLIAEKIAMSMTRNWIKLQATGDDKQDEGKADKLRLLEADMKRYRVQDLFCEAAEYDGFFGLAHIYVDTGAKDDALLQLPLVVDSKTIARGSLRELKIVEPIWTYPNQYDSSNPLAPTFYRPQSWFVMGKIVHATRLLTFVGRQVPDILKPAYNFGGLSLTQMAMPYVNNWIRTRTSVGDLIHNFSVMQLATNMQATLSGGGGEEIIRRAQLFNQARDNRGLMMTDKETEEISNVAVPLANLDKLQAQAQEQIASISSTPLVILLGTTPAGLNASTDGEIRAFYDWIKARQEKLFTANLTKVLQILQLNRFGEIDDEITFKFEPLWQLDDVARATERKTNADTAAVYIAAGVIDPAEERERLAMDDESLYPSLDVNDVPDPPEVEMPGEAERGDGGQAQDAAWSESDHPRREDGKFGEGGGANSASGFSSEAGTLNGASLISSQHYRDDDIVEQKRAEKDYAVKVSPEFEVNGEKMRVVLDGHHSLEAATLDGAEPEFETADESTDDRIALLESGDIEGFLEAVHMGDDYQNAVTKRDAF